MRSSGDETGIARGGQGVHTLSNNATKRTTHNRMRSLHACNLLSVPAPDRIACKSLDLNRSPFSISSLCDRGSGIRSFDQA